MRRERMKVVFEGNEGMIDVNTLITAMTHYNTIALVANDTYGGGLKKMKVNVNAFARGSFIVDFAFVFLKDLLSPVNIGYLSDVVSIIQNVYSLAKSFKGKKIQQEDKEKAFLVLENSNVEIKNVTINVYNKEQAREALAKTFSAVQEDSAIDGLSIRDENGKELVHFDRSDFKELANCDVSDGTEPGERVVYDEDARLSIVSMSFESGRNWGFLYNGRAISMKVKDDALMEAIDRGERFGKGDSIRVRLQIKQKYDSEYNVYKDAGYRIVEFREHVERPEQKSIPFEEECGIPTIEE